MEQDRLWHDSLEDALTALVYALGGPKQVAADLWPSKSDRVRHNRILHCLDAERWGGYELAPHTDGARRPAAARAPGAARHGRADRGLSDRLGADGGLVLMRRLRLPRIFDDPVCDTLAWLMAGVSVVCWVLIGLEVLG